LSKQVDGIILASAHGKPDALRHILDAKVPVVVLPGELADASVDVVIIHQVLHYAQAPAQAIAEAGRLLDRGGRLLIVDFAPHDREELRDTDAHQRLGFADPAIVGWFESAGLTSEYSQHLAGGELTVSLWLARKSGGHERRSASDELGRAA
ncbi:MAG: methyltransferase domain-containing protein, partial [Sphingomonas sp.]|nr:methyltransferase domain-containing protein [Sphingomonas sp.]